MARAVLCFLGFHSWSPWYPWWRDAPRIVFAALEYMNDPTEISDCVCCSKRRSRNPYETGAKAT